MNSWEWGGWIGWLRNVRREWSLGKGRGCLENREDYREAWKGNREDYREAWKGNREDYREAWKGNRED